MGLNISQFSPLAKERYIKIGRQFGSDATLAQGLKTHKAYQENAKELNANGFHSKDAKSLEDACVSLREAGVGRDEAKVIKKVQTEMSKESLKIGRLVRELTRNTLDGVFDDLFMLDSPEQGQWISEVEAALNATSRAEDDADALAGQLALLQKVMERKGIDTLVKARNGDHVLDRLKKSIAQLHETANKGRLRPGTPEHTEHLDLLDGVIVQLVRRARKVAQTIAKEKSHPAFADLFALDRLYK